MENHKHFTHTRSIFSFIAMMLGGIVLAGAMALLLGLIVLWLWNWLMPVIFGLPVISFWQAWGLVVLSHILFKSFPHKNHRKHDDYWKTKFQKKYFCEHDNTAENADASIK